jgi:3'-5' exoribonuclease
MDRSGEVEGRVWDRVDEITTLFERDDFIRVAGKASIYLGKMQLIIQELTRLAESAVDLADFLPVAGRPVAEMVADLNGRVASFSDPHLRALLEAFLADQAFLAAYSRAPAAKAMHHVYLGGLLEHSLAVATLADDICRRYPGLNRDLLVTGALLHDIGKISELRYARSFEYTDVGKLLGHIVIGVEMIEEKLRALPDFPLELAILIKHLLLSHHGQYEYGSPKRPKTMEAVILNFIDDLDSKINGVRTHLDKESGSASAWTQYHRSYDRYFFKGFGEPPAEPDPADLPAPLAGPLATAGPAEAPQVRSVARSAPFNNALQAQLRGVTPSLFGTAAEESNDD